jgi:hypothetical protein
MMQTEADLHGGCSAGNRSVKMPVVDNNVSGGVRMTVVEKGEERRVLGTVEKEHRRERRSD